MTIPYARIRGALRKLWLWSPQRREALKRAKVRGTRWHRCEGCGTHTEKPEVDHLIPVGPTPGARKSGGATWDGLISRLFCSADGLKILCNPCHQAKTHAKEEQAS